MNEDTKKIFDAPWKQEGFDTVVCNDGSEVATGCTSGDAARIARLPELYDALFDAANRLCGEPRYRGQYACESCVVKDSCQVRKWYELLENVRDGK